MNQVILIHGMPSKEEYLSGNYPLPSQANWKPWIKKQLSSKDILCQIPDIPEPYEPKYELWKEALEQFGISNQTTLVGHSCGGGFLLRYLSEHPDLRPKKIILVAPWIDPEPRELTTGFFDFKIDPCLTERTSLHVFMSSDDFEECLKSFEIIEKALPHATYHKFSNREHFDTGTYAIEFPELLEEILR